MKFDKHQLRLLAAGSGGEFNAESLKDAFDFGGNLARKHYENFPVASLLLPKSKQIHIHAIYAFARVADDIADEPTGLSSQERIELLDKMADSLVNGDFTDGNPIFTALSESIRKLNIPKDLFTDLILAFKSDVEFKQPENFEDLEFYCRHSANPVGRLVLFVSGEFDDEKAELSDKICTGLQLVNFWQDLSRDLRNNRVYIPKNFIEKYNIDIENLKNRKNSLRLANCLDSIFSITEKYFEDGVGLLGKIRSIRLKFEISLTISGGMKILEKCRKDRNKLSCERPKIRKSDFPAIIFDSIKNLVKYGWKK